MIECKFFFLARNCVEVEQQSESLIQLLSSLVPLTNLIICLSVQVFHAVRRSKSIFFMSPSIYLTIGGEEHQRSRSIVDTILSGCFHENQRIQMNGEFTNFHCIQHVLLFVLSPPTTKSLLETSFWGKCAHARDCKS